MEGMNGMERGPSKSNPCEADIKSLQERLRVEYQEDNHALREFADTGEVPADLPPEIADELQHLSSTYGAPQVEEAIRKLAA
jgi:hypothetical protein